jgi:hypothetical protein
VAGQGSSSIRTLGAVQVAARLEQGGKIERTARVPAPSGALITGFRLRQISTLFEEDAEVDRRGGMSQRIRLSVCTLGRRAITALLEPKSKVEPFICRTRAANRCVCAPGHPSSPVNVLPSSPRYNDRRIGDFIANLPSIANSG